jgi:hypothetical protein
MRGVRMGCGGWGVGCGCRAGVGDYDVNFGAGDAAADYFARFEARADVEGGGGLFEKGNGDAGVDERAEEHVATDAGEAVEIADTHRLLILNCGRDGLGPKGGPPSVCCKWTYATETVQSAGPLFVSLHSTDSAKYIKA